jgi:hypothetical protein
MPLPIQTDPADIEAICGHLITKPDGASPSELINGKVARRDKLYALKFWGMVEDVGAKLRLSERGRLVARGKGADRTTALQEVVAVTAPYGSIIVRTVHLKKNVILSTEVANYWHQHFSAEVSFGMLNHQTVCFFRVAEGADLGRLVVGRKGQQTRFELAEENARAFVASIAPSPIGTEFDVDDALTRAASPGSLGGSKPEPALGQGNRVFITHRINTKTLQQVKELVAFGKFTPVVAQDRETAKSSPHDVMEEMRGCDTAVVHVGVGGLISETKAPHISGDVLMEIGAAIALFGRNFILLVEEGVELPAPLQGLCECRYNGDELDTLAMMTMFKAFNDFASVPACPSDFVHLVGPGWRLRSAARSNEAIGASRNRGLN